MCVFCEKNSPLVSATAYADNGDEYSAWVDIKDGRLRIKMIRENMDIIEDVDFDEDTIEYCPECGRKLS